MKRVLALMVCAALLALALAGCGEKQPDAGDDLAGVWRGQIDMTDALAQKVAESDLAGFAAVSGFAVTLSLELKDDGAYALTVDQDALESAVETVRGQLRDGTVAYLENMLQERGIGTGLTEAFTAEGKSVDELMGQIDQWVDSFGLDEALDGLNAEGRYQADGGKLYLSAAPDLEPGGAYAAYTLEDDALRLTKGEGEALGAAEAFLPLTFTRA